MSQEPNRPPSPPPVPLEYARPASYEYARPQPDFYQQAARASWVAPVLVLALGMCVNVGNVGANRDPVSSLLMGVVSLLLILAGFVLAIVALFGMRKRGSAGVIGGAIVGLLLNSIFLAGAGSAVVYRSSMRRGAGPPVAPALTPAAQQAADRQRGFDSAANYDGWFGTQPSSGTNIIVMSVGMATPLGQMTRADTPNVGHMMQISLDNSQIQRPVSVDACTVTVHWTDGRRARAMTPADVPPGDRMLAEAIRKLSQNRTAPAGGKLGAVAFFSKELTDLGMVDRVTLEVDGQPRTVPGGLLTVAEKKRLMEAGKAIQAGQ